MTFPGRRGKADIQDFSLFPLSFLELICLKKNFSKSDLVQFVQNKADIPNSDLTVLFKEFENFLAHGGYLTAINDIARENKILNSTLNTYSDWIRGDFLKKGKQESFLQQIIKAIFNRYGSQITWNNLTADLTISREQFAL